MQISRRYERFLKGVSDIEFSDFSRGHERYISIPEISETQEQYILAAKIGDGYVSYGNKQSKAARIAWNMGNKLHALDKQKNTAFLGTVYKEKENPGFGDEWFCLCTKSHPKLNKYVSIGYADVASKLNAIGWAVYYGDDGHLHKKDGLCFIHTEGKSVEDVKSIMSSLNKFLGFDGSRIHSYIGGTKKRTMHCIRLTKRGSNEFMQKTYAYMENGVEYKNIYCKKR